MLTRAPWQPDYVSVFRRRQAMIIMWREKPETLVGALEYYRTRPVEFIEDWCDTYDPRNASNPDKLVRMPLIMFERQRQLVHFLLALLRAEVSGLIEKSRDMGATWVACAFSVWLWLFWPGAAVGWGSRKQMLVDRLGDPDSIFEKIRMIVRGLPVELLPRGFSENKNSALMRLVNPVTDATITGEVGDDIGRGGRKLMYFKDESAHYEHPEMIEASLMDNTRVQVDISSVNGLGNVFHRRREGGTDWTPDTVMQRGKTYVFVMDWRDHPMKDQQWYNARKTKATEEGLQHKFAQEVDRDYAASVEGIVINAEHVAAAIDAHLVLKLERSGGWGAGLDVADGGMDLNGLAVRQGIFVDECKEWGERDIGVTTRNTVAAVRELAPLEVQYDCVGVGSAVKAEYNRLMDERELREGREQRVLPKGIVFVPWNAADAVLHKERRLIDGDITSPLNGNLFHNLKAQAWWHLARRFERTWRAVRKAQGDPEQATFTYDPDDLIVLPSTLPQLRKLQKQLSQAVFVQSASLKLLVDKTPEGTRSPNMADALVMAFWPASGGAVQVTPQLLAAARARAAQVPRRRW